MHTSYVVVLKLTTNKKKNKVFLIRVVLFLQMTPFATPYHSRTMSFNLDWTMADWLSRKMNGRTVSHPAPTPTLMINIVARGYDKAQHKHSTSHTTSPNHHPQISPRMGLISWLYPLPCRLG